MKRYVLAVLTLLLAGSMALAQTTITVAAGAVGQELELARAAAERYMAENPGVTVEVLETPTWLTAVSASTCRSSRPSLRTSTSSRST